MEQIYANIGQGEISYSLTAAPRVEAGKNTSTLIPASRKRRQNGNPVVSGETASRPKKKVNEDLSLDKPLQVIYIVSKLAYT
jgi:hypothetical protein